MVVDTTLSWKNKLVMSLLGLRVFEFYAFSTKKKCDYGFTYQDTALIVCAEFDQVIEDVISEFHLMSSSIAECCSNLENFKVEYGSAVLRQQSLQNNVI